MKRSRRRKKSGRGTRSANRAPQRRRGWYLSIACGALVVLVCLVILGRSGTDSTATPHADSASSTNLLLITLDTTRADRIGCYGYAKAETPTIDGLARSGVRFEHAYTHVPLTLPAHTSLLAGLYPVSTGVHINGAVALGSDVATVATIFKERGYRTGAFIGSSVLDSAFGLARGFDLYDDDIRGDTEGGDQVQRSADAVCDAALQWLATQPDTAFLAWVHFFDPHTPYEPPPDFARRFSDPYDGEIAFVDTQVRRLLDWLDARSLRDQTLIVIAGDHGESLQEHGEAEHGFFIYNATMHVPLVLSHPSLFSKSQQIESPAGLVDVLPTILELLGWAGPGDLDGRSLASACRGSAGPIRPVYGESEYSWLSFGWAPLRSLMDGTWKLIDAPKVELYELASDPEELTNLAEANPKKVVALQRDLEEMIAAMKKREASVVTPDASALERLAGLGYVAGSTQAEADPDAQLRDPKDMFGIFEGFTRALGLVREHRFAAAADILEQAIRISPESDEMFSVLGTAYLKLDRFEDAQRAYETSLRKSGDSPRRLSGLGEALRRQNKLQDAKVCFEEALRLASDWGPAHRGLGAIYSSMNRFSEGEPHWRACVEQNPTNVNCLVNLGSTLVVLGRPSEALAMLERALKEEPGNEFAHHSLWRALAALGRRTEAVERLEKAVNTFPSAISLTCPLARLLATTRGTKAHELERATNWAQACCQAQPDDPTQLDTLAAVWAARHDFGRAIEIARKAIEVARAMGRSDLVQKIQNRVRLYESETPYTE